MGDGGVGTEGKSAVDAGLEQGKGQPEGSGGRTETARQQELGCFSLSLAAVLSWKGEHMHACAHARIHAHTPMDMAGHVQFPPACMVYQ